MKIHLDSNFSLLGVKDMDSIDFEEGAVTLRDLLDALSRRPPHPLKLLQPGGKALSPGWDIEINGQPLALCDKGLDTTLSHGDRVAVKLELLSGG